MKAQNVPSVSSTPILTEFEADILHYPAWISKVITKEGGFRENFLQKSPEDRNADLRRLEGDFKFADPMDTLAIILLPFIQAYGQER